jgi:hypothetical protein
VDTKKLEAGKSRRYLKQDFTALLKAFQGDVCPESGYIFYAVHEQAKLATTPARSARI